MFYIVAGRTRSGTSLMMRILKVIGIDPIYDQNRENWLLSNGPSNPYFYEHPQYLTGQITSEFITMNDGKSLKVLGNGIRSVPKLSNVQVIYMYRDAEARTRSMNPTLCSHENQIPDRFRHRLWRAYKQRSHEIEARSLKPQQESIQQYTLNNFNSIVIDYDKLIDNTTVTVNQIKTFLGIGFDVAIVASEVDPNRREHVGTGLFDPYKALKG